MSHKKQINWSSNSLQDSIQSLVQAANLSPLLSNASGNYTLFAPSDTAITAALANKDILCQTDYEDDDVCTSFSAVVNSTSLTQLLLNHGKLNEIMAQLLSNHVQLSENMSQLLLNHSKQMEDMSQWGVHVV